MPRRKRDEYTKKAFREGYRSRAAYKIMEIDQKYHIFYPNTTIIDLCGAPGGFSQVARDRSKSKKILLVDMARVKKIPGIKIIKKDITQLETILEIKEILDKWHSWDNPITVLADCSPNVSGSWTTDHEIQIWLAQVALGIANYFLAQTFVTKVFQGSEYGQFLKTVREYYMKVKAFKPTASRSSSAETYVIARKRRKKSEKRFDEEFLFNENE